MVDVAFEGRYKPIFLIDNSPIHKWVLYSAFYFPFFLNLIFLRTMPPDALNARSMNCKGKAIGLFIYKHICSSFEFGISKREILYFVIIA